MTSRKVWSGVWPLSIILAFVVGLFLLGKIGREIDKEIVENGREGVGVAFGEGSRMVGVKHVVGGVEYSKGFGKDFDNVQDGEEFVIMYLPEDPSSMVVFFDRPILSSNYEYSETVCTHLERNLTVLMFEYVVDGETFKRETYYGENRSLELTDYVIRYRTENPKIGYLLKK
jgi:hypothetical protein